jgi:hypothetical protein
MLTTAELAQVFMQFIARIALVLLAASSLANARPVTVENVATFGTPDSAYVGFGGDVAMWGDFALVTASRPVPVADGETPRDFQTAFLFRRNGTRWDVVRRLEEYEENPDFRIRPAVAMRDDLAVVQTRFTDFYALVADDWVRAPAVIETDGPGRSLEISAGRVLSGEGTCSNNGRIFERDTAGTWRTSALLTGPPGAPGCDDEFRGGAAALEGDTAAVHQADPEGFPTPFTTIYRRLVAEWVPFADAVPPANATTFGEAVALRAGDALVSGSPESGTYVYRETGSLGFQLATRIQTVDGFMGGGRARGFAKSPDLLLQHGLSFDRGGVGVVNVFRRDAGGEYAHVAILAARNGASLGTEIAISGGRVLVGDNGDGLIYYFELPVQLAARARVQETFTNGAANWSPSPGSLFTVVTGSVSRIFRQLDTAGTARTVLAANDWTAQAIEADVKPRVFGASGAGFGLTTRFQNEQNYYEVMIRNSGRVELRRMASGVLRTLASAAFTPVPFRHYRLRLESIGTLHRVHIDGALVLDFDITGPTHGRAGLVTDRTAADFDNVTLSPTLKSTIYSTGFEAGAAGPWQRTGLGFWMLSPDGSRTTWFQSSIAGDARAAIGVPTGDQIVRVRARLDTFATPEGAQERWFGLMARYVDSRNYYYLSLRSSNTVMLRKVVNGTFTTLATAPFTVKPAQWYQLRLDTVGNRLRGYVNGVPLLEATDESLPSGISGPVMFKAAVDYDDFAAYQP